MRLEYFCLVLIACYFVDFVDMSDGYIVERVHCRMCQRIQTPTIDPTCHN